MKNIWEYYEQLHDNKLNDLDGMDKFLDLQNLWRLNYEEMENLNILVTNKEIESVIKNLPAIKSFDYFTGELYQII